VSYERYTRLLCALVLAFALPVAGAQQKPPSVEFKYEIEAARKLIDKERRVVIAGEMNLTDAERKEFWELYADYAAEMSEVSKDYANQITRYADNFDNMTDAVAKELLEGYFRVRRNRLKIREKYRRRYAKVLPVIKVARFYQVESKLDAVYDFQLASQIPLIEDPRQN
jgi:hypothetical protein